MYAPAVDGRPILCVDVDGVINFLGGPSKHAPDGVSFEILDGVPHAIFTGVGERLKRLASSADLVWATGWGRRANEVFPALFGFDPLPEVSFAEPGSRTDAAWKVAPIEQFAGDRAVAWVDDSFNHRCDNWARRRSASGRPTLLVGVHPDQGLQDQHVERIESWARQLQGEAFANPNE